MYVKCFFPRENQLKFKKIRVKSCKKSFICYLTLEVQIFRLTICQRHTVFYTIMVCVL